jgi:hypothetical protein
MANTYTGSDVGQAGLNVKKTDNSVDVNGVTEIQLDTNLTLTPNGGGSVTIQSSGGGGGGTISGTIADTQVAYGTAADTIGGDANFTWDSSRQLLEVTYSTLANVYEVVADVDISKGEAVYTTGFNGGSGKPSVDLAQANSSSTMPAIGIAAADITAGQTGFVIIDGELDGITTSGSANDILYVSATVAGAVTNVRPTGATELVQNMGNIIKVGAGGKIAVTTIGRSNDVPNSFSISGSISADLITLTNPLDISNGGTNASTASGARTSLGAAASGANSDITSLSGLTTPLSVAQGGTGANTLTNGGVLLGSGTGAISATAVLTNGQLLIGDGTGDPTVATLTAGTGITITNGAGSITISSSGGSGTVTSVDTGSNLTGGPITGAGTIDLLYDAIIATAPNPGQPEGFSGPPPDDTGYVGYGWARVQTNDPAAVTAYIPIWISA